MASSTLQLDLMDRGTRFVPVEEPDASQLGRRAGALGGLLQVVRVVQAIVGVALFAAIGVVLAGVAPTLVGYESFTVYSGSMEPGIQVGALAVVRAVPSAELRPGDVITYRTPTQPDVIITHRLVSIVETGDGKRQFRTKGDANAVEDIVQVDGTGVLGKVVYSVPYAGYIVEFSKQPQGRIILIVLPLLALGMDFLRGRLRTRAQAARQEANNATAMQAGASEADRTALLIERGNLALERGHSALAERAAEGILALDPRSEDGWLLKSRALTDHHERLQLLQAAVLLNPGATRLASELAQLRQGHLWNAAMGEASETGAVDSAGADAAGSVPAKGRNAQSR